jgi:sugar lactone lactonase YvrE
MDGFLQREREELKTRWTGVLVLLTCLAMILVVAQQGGTIDTQRNLIRVLWDDSKQLNKMRVQDLVKQRDKIYATDPNYVAPGEKAPAEKAAPKAKRPPSQEVLPPKPARVLRQI